MIVPSFKTPHYIINIEYATVVLDATALRRYLNAYFTVR